MGGVHKLLRPGNLLSVLSLIVTSGRIIRGLELNGGEAILGDRPQAHMGRHPPWLPPPPPGGKVFAAEWAGAKREKTKFHVIS